MKNRNGRSSPAPVDPARLEELARTAFDGWLIVDDARRYVHVNEPAAELLGAPVKEILKRRMDDFTPPEKKDVLDRAWTELERQGTLYGKGETVRGDGSRSLVESRAVWNVAPGQHLIFMRGVPSG